MDRGELGFGTTSERRADRTSAVAKNRVLPGGLRMQPSCPDPAAGTRLHCGANAVIGSVREFGRQVDAIGNISLNRLYTKSYIKNSVDTVCRYNDEGGHFLRTESARAVRTADSLQSHGMRRTPDQIAVPSGRELNDLGSGRPGEERGR